MLNPGVYDLGALNLGAANSGTRIGNGTGAVVNQAGVQSVGFQAKLDVVGTQVGTAWAYLQTSLDQGTTWFDIACAFLGGTSGVKLLPLAFGSGAAFAPVDGALADDTSLRGPFGDRFAVRIKTAGTFNGNTVFTGRVVTAG